MSSNNTDKIKFKYRLEYRTVKVIGAICSSLPYSAALNLARALAFIAFHVMRSRREEAIRRILFVKNNEISRKEAKKIAWISLRNTAYNLIEMLRIKKIDKPAVYEIFINLDECIKTLTAIKSKCQGKGFILALPHMGNWDLAGSAVFLSDIPIFSIAGKQRNPLMNDLINNMREGHGMAIIERGSNALVQTLSRIKRGELFAILPDTRSFTPDILTPFLNGEANLARGMAAFARSANVPIVPSIIKRLPDRKFSITLYDPIYPDMSEDKNSDIVRLTHQTIAIIDREIKNNPEQWFWYNKRWVLDPVIKQ